MYSVFAYVNAASSMLSPTISLTPDTQKYTSELSELPSSSEKYNSMSINILSWSKLQLQNEKLENQPMSKLQKLLNNKKQLLVFFKCKFKFKKLIQMSTNFSNQLIFHLQVKKI